MAPIYEFNEEQGKAIETLGIGKRRTDLENLSEDKFEQIAELDRSDWIIVPKKEGNKFVRDSYAFDRSPARISFCSAVEKAGRELRINYTNTSMDSLGREFVGENNWKESMMLAQFLGVKATNLNKEIDYLHLLYLGWKDKIKVYDVSGKQIDLKLCEKLLMDSIKIKSPWRANWIDTDYKIKGEFLEVHSDHIFNRQGDIISYKSEILDEDTLTEDKQIDVIDFITRNHTSQGGVSKSVESGNFYYWYPRRDNNSVVRFDAGSGRAVFYCDRYPHNRSSSLGVFVAKTQ